jgi:hypothetical protein
MLALSAKGSVVAERALGVAEESRTRGCSSGWRAMRPREEETEAHGSAGV